MTEHKLAPGSAPIPGFGEGRPLAEPAGGKRSPQQHALKLAWAAAFLERDGVPHGQGRLMLEDLAQHCHGAMTTAKADPTGRADPFASAVAEGRRQALLFILARLGLKQGLFIP